MKTDEFVSPFAYSYARERTLLFTAPTSYLNRDLVRQAYDALRPGWEGFATALPLLPEAVQVTPNPIPGVLVGDIPVFLRDMQREGG